MLSLLTSSIASFSFLSNNALASVKPVLVFPKLLGPLLVIVCRPMFFIFILASSGISSSSLLESPPKTAGAAGLSAREGLGRVPGVARDIFIPVLRGLPLDVVPKAIGFFSSIGGNGAGETLTGRGGVPIIGFTGSTLADGTPLKCGGGIPLTDKGGTPKGGGSTPIRGRGTPLGGRGTPPNGGGGTPPNSGGGIIPIEGVITLSGNADFVRGGGGDGEGDELLCLLLS